MNGERDMPTVEDMQKEVESLKRELAVQAATQAERVRVKSSPSTQRNRVVPAPIRLLPFQVESAITDDTAHI